MKYVKNWLGIVFVAVFAIGCSDDTTTLPDAKGNDGALDMIQSETGIILDNGISDLQKDTTQTADAPTGNYMGEGCANKSECGSLDCLMIDKSQGLGVCSRSCTPDDTTTPLINEDDCPSDFTCSTFSYTSGDFYYCLKDCTPSLTQNPCPTSSKTTCHPASTRFVSLSQTVCWYLACVTDEDCPVYSEQSCNTNADCTGIAADAFCDNHLCAKPGNCTPGGVCGKHTAGSATAKVGDPCTSDFDCPNNGACIQEEAGATGPDYHNGYCIVPYCAFSGSLTDYVCPTGSTCFQLFYGGACLKTCDMTKEEDCRNNPDDNGGDYECLDWGTWSIGGIAIAAEPVCMNAPDNNCDGIPSGYDCSSYAPQGNPTNMTCRDQITGEIKTDPLDPRGICLDDTASGEFQSATDAGVDTTIAVDAGIDTASAG